MKNDKTNYKNERNFREKVKQGFQVIEQRLNIQQRKQIDLADSLNQQKQKQDNHNQKTEKGLKAAYFWLSILVLIEAVRLICWAVN